MKKHVVAFLRKKYVASSSFLEKPQCVGQHGGNAESGVERTSSNLAARDHGSLMKCSDL